MPSAYILFSNAIRPQLKEGNPDTKPRDIMRMIAEKWRAMSLDDKKEYQDEAASKKKKEVPEKIKKPITAYIFFSKDTFKTTTGTFKERTVEVASKWKALSDEEKQPYIELAEKDIQRYTEAIEKKL